VNDDRLEQPLHRTRHLAQVVHQGPTRDTGDRAGRLGFCPEGAAVVRQDTDFPKVLTFVALADIQVAPVVDLLAEPNCTIQDKVDGVGDIPFFKYDRATREILKNGCLCRSITCQIKNRYRGKRNTGNC
jgi:hypothetical protein